MSGGWIVDAHTHIFPPRLATKIRAFFERHIVEAPDSEGNHDPIPCCPPPEVFEKEYHTLNDLKPHRAAPIPMHSHDLEQIVPPMRDAHIGGNWILPYAHKADMADQLNTDIVKISQKLQEHYGMNTVPGFTVHPSDGPEAVGRIARQAILRGARVAKLHCSVGAYSVLHPNFAPFWSLSEQILWPTVVHAGGHASGQTLIKELEQIDKLAERYPKARIIIAHSGAPACKQGIELAMKRPNVYLDTTTGVVSLPPLPTPAQQPHYDYMIKLAREGRILFGSDIPNVAMQLPDVVRGNTQVFDVDGKFTGGRVPQSLEEAGKEGDPLYELFYGAATRLVREVKPEAAAAAQASL